LQGKIHVRKDKATKDIGENTFRGQGLSQVREGEGWGEGYSGIMSSGKPVFVSEMYSPSLRARIRWGLVHSGRSCPREESSFGRRFQTLELVGQVRMCHKQ